MPIYMTKLQTKLDAILAKNQTQILAYHPYLPFLGSNYTSNQLKNWIKKASDMLTSAKTMSEAQIEAYKNNVYNSLGAADKLIADKILANNGQLYSLGNASNEDGYNKLVMLVLYIHITTI